MKKRNTQWIKGLELFHHRKDNIQSKLQYLENYFQEQLPQSLKAYLLQWQPFDIYDYSNYEEEIFFWEPGYLAVQTPKKSWGDAYPISKIYDIDEIVLSLMTEDNCSLGFYQRQIKVFPIASNGSPDGDIILSLADETKGKIYTLVDYQVSECNENTLIANSLDDFILNLEVLQMI